MPPLLPQRPPTVCKFYGYPAPPSTPLSEENGGKRSSSSSMMTLAILERFRIIFFVLASDNHSWHPFSSIFNQVFRFSASHIAKFIVSISSQLHIVRNELICSFCSENFENASKISEKSQKFFRSFVDS